MVYLVHVIPSHQIQGGALKENTITRAYNQIQGGALKEKTITSANIQ